MSDQVKYVLDEKHIPEAWYNIAADLPEPPPPVLHPGTGQPVGPDDLAPLFPMEIILQEVSTEQRIAIPDEVRDVYRQWRPTPLFRARRLERALETPARIYYKYEGVSPTGSHKPNTAIAQAYYNKREGVKRLTTETGAGQWGSSLAFAGRRPRARRSVPRTRARTPTGRRRSRSSGASHPPACCSRPGRSRCSACASRPARRPRTCSRSWPASRAPSPAGPRASAAKAATCGKHRAPAPGYRHSVPP